MARRVRQEAAPTPSLDYETAYGRLGWMFATSDRAVDVDFSRRVREEVTRLDATGAPIAERLDALVDFIDGLGHGDPARRIVGLELEAK